MTLGLYAQAMNVDEADRKRLRALVGGSYLAVAGSGTAAAAPAGREAASAESSN